MAFKAKIVGYREWRDILNSDNSYRYTMMHIEPFINKKGRFTIVYYKDEPAIGFPNNVKKKILTSTLMLHYNGLPYLGFVVFSSKLIRDIDLYMNMVRYISTATIIGKTSITYAKNPVYLYDPRGFLWSGWMVRTEYTYISYPDKVDINSLRKIRRREYRKASKEKFIIKNMEFKEYIKYYLEFAKKKGFYEKAGHEIIKRIIEDKSINDKILVKVAVSDKGIGAGESFLIDKYVNTAYRLFPFTTEYGRRTGAATYLLYHVIKDELYYLPYIVMLGAMSPMLARFVQDFSHEIKPYYSLLFIKNRLMRKVLKLYIYKRGFIQEY